MASNRKVEVMSKIKTNTISNVAGTVNWPVETMGIESGENQYWAWTKFPDGTSILRSKAQQVLAALPTANEIYAYTDAGGFPADLFIDTDVTISINSGLMQEHRALIFVAAMNDSTSMKIGALCPKSSTIPTLDVWLQIVAMGRWK